MSTSTFTCGFTEKSIQYALFIQKNDKASLCELSHMYGLKNNSNTSSKENAARALLTQMLTDEDKDFQVKMTKDNEIEMFKILDLPDISTRVKPDLALVCDNGYVAFVEVESETYIRTIRKICFVLMLHLMCVKLSLAFPR